MFIIIDLVQAFPQYSNIMKTLKGLIFLLAAIKKIKKIQSTALFICLAFRIETLLLILVHSSGVLGTGCTKCFKYPVFPVISQSVHLYARLEASYLSLFHLKIQSRARAGPASVRGLPSVPHFHMHTQYQL